MKVRGSLIAIAAGAILATAAAGYSAPAHRYYGNNDRQGYYGNDPGYYASDDHQGRTGEERGESYAQRGERLDRRSYWQRGEAMEERSGRSSREGERQRFRGLELPVEVRDIGEPGPCGDDGNGHLRFGQHPAGMADSNPRDVLPDAFAHVLHEVSRKRAFRETRRLGQRRKTQGLGELCLDQREDPVQLLGLIP